MLGKKHVLTLIIFCFPYLSYNLKNSSLLFPCYLSSTNLAYWIQHDKQPNFTIIPLIIDCLIFINLTNT